MGADQSGSYGQNIEGATHTLSPIIGGAKHTILPLLVNKIPIIEGAIAPSAPPITTPLHYAADYWDTSIYSIFTLIAQKIWQIVELGKMCQNIAKNTISNFQKFGPDSNSDPQI